MKDINDILNSQQHDPKEPPFDVPPGYFETFEDRLEAQITASEEKPSKRKTIIRILKPIAGLAASFLLIMLLLKYPLKKITPELASQDETSLSEESNLWQEIFMGNTVFFDDNTLVTTMNTDESSNPGESEELINILSSELTDYEIYAELYNQ